MGCSMLFSYKPADAGFIYTEEEPEAGGVLLVSGTSSKVFSCFAVVFEKQFILGYFGYFSCFDPYWKIITRDLRFSLLRFKSSFNKLKNI